MNRLQILVLNKTSDRDGVYTVYVDVPSAIAFLQRTGHLNRYMIVAHKGLKSLFIEKIDPATILKQLNDFQVQNQ
jgi:hypothetical protein